MTDINKNTSNNICFTKKELDIIYCSLDTYIGAIKKEIKDYKKFKMPQYVIEFQNYLKEALKLENKVQTLKKED